MKNLFNNTARAISEEDIRTNVKVKFGMAISAIEDYGELEYAYKLISVCLTHNALANKQLVYGCDNKAIAEYVDGCTDKIREIVTIDSPLFKNTLIKVIKNLTGYTGAVGLNNADVNSLLGDNYTFDETKFKQLISYDQKNHFLTIIKNVLENLTPNLKG